MYYCTCIFYLRNYFAFVLFFPFFFNSFSNSDCRPSLLQHSQPLYILQYVLELFEFMTNGHLKPESLTYLNYHSKHIRNRSFILKVMTGN